MRRSPLLALAVAGGTLTACPGPPSTVAAPTQLAGPGDSFGDAAGVQCNAVRPQTEPDLMAWDPGSRANLARLRDQGVVAVRYAAQGCNVELELLPNCIGQGARYTFRPYPEKQTKSAHNAQELYAELPLGSARLHGKLKGQKMIRTDYMLVGTASLPAGSTFLRTSLVGDCARATHVISSVYLGGSQMYAGDARDIEGGASVYAIAGGGVDWASKAERLDSAGDTDACQNAARDGKESMLCAVPLRVGLLALSGGGATAEQPRTAAGEQPKPPKPAAPTPTIEPAPAPPPPAASSPSTPTPKATVSTREIRFQPLYLQFETAKATMLPSSYPQLDQVVDVLRANPDLHVQVQGHTDSQGDDTANLKLSMERALAVKTYILNKGIDASRVTHRGYGATQPIDDNKTPAGRAKNRRIEIQVIR